MAKDYKTYEYFVHGLKNWNEFLAKPAGFEHFYGVSIKFERLAKAVLLIQTMIVLFLLRMFLIQSYLIFISV